MLQFSTVCQWDKLQGILTYRQAEHSFGFEAASESSLRRRIGGAGTTSIGIGMLQIEVAVETGVALFVWGYHPRSRWEVGECGPPGRAVSECIAVSQLEGLAEGVSINLVAINEWPTRYDQGNGWIHVGPFPHATNDKLIEFATDILAVVNNGFLRGLWLHPQFI